MILSTKVSPYSSSKLELWLNNVPIQRLRRTYDEIGNSLFVMWNKACVGQSWKGSPTIVYYLLEIHMLCCTLYPLIVMSLNARFGINAVNMFCELVTIYMISIRLLDEFRCNITISTLRKGSIILKILYTWYMSRGWLIGEYDGAGLDRWVWM